jgi:hypothetical protein
MNKSQHIGSSGTQVQSVDNLESTDCKPSQSKPRPKRRSDLTYRTIEGETVILDREEGRLHQLNPTGSFIWNCCDGTSKIDEIVDRLANAYEIDSITGRQDVEEVLSKLRSLNLLRKY